jgi:hypothetical protein
MAGDQRAGCGEIVKPRAANKDCESNFAVLFGFTTVTPDYDIHSR